jgi:short-subunit dehydrogenase
MQLEGSKLYLTGAAGGIGSLLAKHLRARGAFVTGIDRVPSNECDDSIVANLGDEKSLASLSEMLAGLRVDILCNLAGMQYFGPIDRQDPANIWMGYVVNLVAPAMLIRAVLPQMRARGSGQIVNIGSVMGAVNYPHFATYSSAKAGLRGLSEGIRRELGNNGIAVTYIAPRAVRTSFNDEAVNRFLELAKMHADDPEIVAARIAKAIAARRKEVTIGTAERVYTRLNGLFPRLVDAGLAGVTSKARTLFQD